MTRKTHASRLCERDTFTYDVHFHHWMHSGSTTCTISLGTFSQQTSSLATLPLFMILAG